MPIEKRARSTSLVLAGDDAEEAQNAEIFLRTFLAIGQMFLSCGGPVTRFENEMIRAGKLFGYDVSVHATPSNIFACCHVNAKSRTYNRFCRIPTVAVNLGRLRCVDRLLSNFASGRMSPERCERRLKSIALIRTTSGGYVHSICVFAIGFSASALGHGALIHCLYGGLLTLAVDLLMTLLKKNIVLNGAVSTFLSCFITLLCARVISHFIGIPSSILSIGMIAYVVPGLTLTTGISEIVDQNFLAGTIRLLSAFYTLMVMGLAFYLVNDLSQILGWVNVPMWQYAEQNKLLEIATRVFSTILILLAFSIEFGAHKRSLLRILLCGVSGVMVLSLLAPFTFMVLSTFLAAFAVGLISFWLSRRYKHPSQIYSLPSIVSLVPGLMAFSSFGYGQASRASSAETINFVIHALLISLAIVFGLAFGRVTLTKKQWIGAY